MSHHFLVLKEADLITCEREGQKIWYSLNTTVLQDVVAWGLAMIRGDRTKRGG
jgi:DNA-binding transcriptional ArsR family regulator